MTPSQNYHEFLQQSGFHHDPMQQHVVSLLDRLQHEIIEQEKNEGSLFSRLANSLNSNRSPVMGLYIWGGVGRGKTFLMDVFFQALKIPQKKRLHFHHFMKMIHDQLKLLKQVKDPIVEVARNFARDTRVLCLDEFVVTDIGDAMLTGRLLKALFDQGIVLVTTSNTPPQDLYRDGLQRANFEPTIELLIRYCSIVHLDGGQDYRALGFKQTRVYQYPHNEKTDEMIQQFLKSHLLSGQVNGQIEINDRAIAYEYCAEDTIWFTFEQLCKTARSRLDYLELARSFNTLVVTGIEHMGHHCNDVSQRFIALIDVLYDHRVKLICSASVEVNQLYPKGPLAFEFKRTQSRLLEMQNEDYLALAHRIN